VIGPVSYVVNESDLSTVTPGNSMFKYADDTYVVIPACNALSRDAELDNVAKWAVTNNLQLNRAMSVEGHDNIQRPITRKRYKIEL